MTSQAVWWAAAAGWLLVAAGIARWPPDTARTAALTAHVLAPFGALLVSAFAGFGFLLTSIALAAQWWALALVTLCRPERLADPAGGGLVRLAVWLGTAAALAYGLTALTI